jgi:hypothetical protein
LVRPGEDALANLSIEKADGVLQGHVRIRSKTQGIALSLGDKITLLQRYVKVSKLFKEINQMRALTPSRLSSFDHFSKKASTAVATN